MAGAYSADVPQFSNINLSLTSKQVILNRHAKTEGLTSRLKDVKLLEVHVKDAIHPPMDDRTELCSHADVRRLVGLPAPIQSLPSVS